MHSGPVTTDVHKRRTKWTVIPVCRSLTGRSRLKSIHAAMKA
jgi:hypothetical protein